MRFLQSDYSFLPGPQFICNSCESNVCPLVINGPSFTWLDLLWQGTTNLSLFVSCQLKTYSWDEDLWKGNVKDDDVTRKGSIHFLLQEEAEGLVSCIFRSIDGRLDFSVIIVTLGQLESTRILYRYFKSIFLEEPLVLCFPAVIRIWYISINC